MAQKQLFIFFLLLLILLAFSGCATNHLNNLPKSPEEIKIKELLSKWENTINMRDAEGNLALYNDNAQIMYTYMGMGRNIGSKKEYAKVLPGKLKEIQSVSIGTPVIKISGDRAQVSFDLTVGMNLRNYQSRNHIELIKENDTWSIMSYKY